MIIAGYEDRHGRMQYFDDDPEHNDGFTWSCCEERGSSKGRRKTKHKAEDHPRKKGRSGG